MLGHIQICNLVIVFFCYQIASLDPESVADQLQPLEQEVYSWQRKVYDVQLEISQLEEELIRNRIQVLQQEQRGNYNNNNNN